MRPLALLVAFFAATATGATWTRGDLPREPVYDLVAHPTIGGIAFAVTSSGTYRTIDAGRHWQQTADVVLRAFDFNPFRAAEVCALVDWPRMVSGHTADAYCSVDFGRTWSPAGGFSFLLFDRRVPGRMYSGVGYGNNWIAVSNDHGVTWEIKGYTPGHPNFHGWAATDADSNVFVTSWPHGGGPDYFWQQPFYRSRDGGSTWEYAGASPIRWMVATDSSLRSTFYAVEPLDSYDNNVELRASTDAGVTWKTLARFGIDALMPSITSLATDPTNSAHIYVGTQNGDIFSSLDGGKAWTHIYGEALHAAHGVTVAVGTDGVVYAATDDAVFTLISVPRRHVVGRR